MLVSDGPAHNRSYVGARSDLLSMVPDRAYGRVLDVGCATGATSAELKQRLPGCHVTGIELDQGMAELARERLDRVLVGDASALLTELRDSEDDRFDLVLCGDVLEHLVDPWAALGCIRKLCPTGTVIVSLPNVAHVSTVVALLFGSYWPYRDRGIHDRTHLRFFGRNNLAPLFAAADFKEVRRFTHHRVIERPHRLNQWLAPIVSRLPLIRRLTEYQFISVLE
jgi:2-polyprenyl-3-methyl-5-hydroxy-6-metoxy-1,4-benzoquinol methylase